MSESTFFVSEAAVRNLKLSAERRLSGVSSSHLSEGVAAALGFKTHAALRAALSGRTTAKVSKPQNSKLAQRLRQFGYTGLPADLQGLPDLDQSYLLYRTAPLRQTRGPRWWAWRNLMVMTINAGIEQRLFGLSPGQNWWPGGAPESHNCETATYRFTIGDLVASASVDAISGDELSIAVVLNPKTTFTPSVYCDLRDGDATAQCWVERRLGAWIQDGGEDFHCKRVLQPRLAGLMVTPHGYGDQGSFFM